VKQAADRNPGQNTHSNSSAHPSAVALPGQTAASSGASQRIGYKGEQLVSSSIAAVPQQVPQVEVNSLPGSAPNNITLVAAADTDNYTASDGVTTASLRHHYGNGHNHGGGGGGGHGHLQGQFSCDVCDNSRHYELAMRADGIWHCGKLLLQLSLQHVTISHIAMAISNRRRPGEVMMMWHAVTQYNCQAMRSIRQIAPATAS